MKFRLPFSRPEPLATPPAPEPSDRIALMNAREEGAQAERERLADTMRLIVSNAPVPLVPLPGVRPPYQAYGFDQPIRFSTPQAPTRRPGSPVTIETLRALADNYDILRSCINHLKREVSAVPFEIVSRDPESKASGKAKPSKPLNRNQARRLEEAKNLFSTPGPIGGINCRLRHFEFKWIEDVCVVGAAAIFCQNTIGGGMFQALAIDASTIRPFTDAYGWPPPDSGPYKDHVYEQWVYGVQAAIFGRADMIYDGVYSSSYSPYFKSPVEWLLYTTDTALRSDNWNRTWLTEGTTPSDMLALPETWTPDNIKEFSDFWKVLTGNSAARQQTKFVPGGSQKVGSTGRKDQDFTEQDLFCLRRCCSIMGVQPASIGFTGEQYKVTQDESMNATTQFGAGVLLAYRKDLYDDLLQRAGYGEFEMQNVESEKDDSKEKSETNEVLIRSGQRTINECRKDDGFDPLTDEGTDVPLIASTLTTLDKLVTAPVVDPNAAKIGPDGKPLPIPGEKPTTKTKSAPGVKNNGDKNTPEKNTDANN